MIYYILNQIIYSFIYPILGKILHIILNRVIIMYEEFFADRLSELRAEKNVSAREMSLALGQNASYINRIENRKAFPSMQLFFYICEYLGITPEDFFSQNSRYPEQLQNLIADLKELNESQLAALGEIAKGLKR